MSTSIYYFSGTGNSLKVAKDIIRDLNDATLIPISKKLSEDIINAETDSIGIIFPVYYYGIPHIVKDFIKKLKVTDENYIFAVATCGGSVGSAIKQIEKQMLANGGKLSAGFRIIMPENYQIMFPVPSKNKIEKIFDSEKNDVKTIVEKIRNHEEVKFIDKGRVFANIFGGVLSSTFKPYNKDRHFWTNEKCNGCSLCSKICPVNNIHMSDGKPVWKNKCEQCLACMQWCPQKSIQYKKGTIKKGRYTNPEIKPNEMLR